MQFPCDFYSAAKDYATFDKPVAAPCFRKKFYVENKYGASLVICGLGFYELFVNGQRITKGRLASYISNPDKVLYYDTYDVTEHITKGENVVAVILGNGFLNCIGGAVWEFDKAPYRASPKFALRFTMGELCFDAGEFVTSPSPIIFDDMRAGEWYDARLEIPHFAEPCFDDSTWSAVIPSECPRGIKKENTTCPITVRETLKPVSFRKGRISIFPNVSGNITDIPFPDDEKETEGYLYDFGVNTSGVCALKIKNTRPGQKIILQYGEILGDNPEGGKDTTVRNENSGLDLRGFHFLPNRFNHRDVYICKGAEQECYEPFFTHHGFRYCLVIGLEDAQAEENTLKAVTFHTELESRATFKCSDETVNRIWQAGIRSDLTNFCHFPTDCPHREKNGWTGDAQLSAEHMLILFSCEANLKEWLFNLRLAMRSSGELPGIVPTAGWGFGFGPAWDAVITEIPYQIWRKRGDTDVISENASAILRYIHYLSTRMSEKGLIEFGLGDWCQAAHIGVDNPTAPVSFTSTVIAMDICRKASVLFRAAGLTFESEYAGSIGDKLKESGRKQLLDLENMTALNRCQTTQAMAIYYGLFEDYEKPAAAQKLVGMIHDNEDSFDCGILGMRVIFHVLSRFGYTDLALHMITKPQFPSYGYLINHGATTLWELFSPIEQAQSSCNHHFFGDITSWFIENLAGIRHNPDGENISSVIISPRFPKALQYAQASVEIPFGWVKCHWERKEDHILLCADIPSGAQAFLQLEEGLQTDKGVTRCSLEGVITVKIIPSNVKNSLRKTAKN